MTLQEIPYQRYKVLWICWGSSGTKHKPPTPLCSNNTQLYSSFHRYILCPKNSMNDSNLVWRVQDGRQCLETRLAGHDLIRVLVRLVRDDQVGAWIRQSYLQYYKNPPWNLKGLTCKNPRHYDHEEGSCNKSCKLQWWCSRDTLVDLEVVHILFFFIFFAKEKTCQKKTKKVISPDTCQRIYTHLYFVTVQYICMLSLQYIWISSGLSGCLVPTPGLKFEYPTCSVCVCIHTLWHNTCTSTPC